MGKYFTLLAKNSSSNLSFYVLNQVIALLSYAILIRLLGLKEYGLLMFMQALSGQFHLFAESIGTSVVKYIPEFNSKNVRGKISPLVSGAFFALFIIGLLISLVNALLLYFDLYSLFDIEHDAGVRNLFVIAIITTPLNYAGFVFGSALKGFHRFHHFNVIDVTGNTLAFVLTLLLALLQKPLYIIFLGIELVLLMKYCLMFMAVGVKVRFTGMRSSLAVLKEVFHYAKWTLLQGTNSTIINSIDSILVSWLLGVQSLPIYRGIKKVILLPSHLNTQIKSAVLPIASEIGASTNREEINEILLKGTTALNSISAPIAVCFIIFAQPVLSILGGEHLLQYALIYQIVSLVYIVLTSRAFLVTFHLGHGVLIRKITLTLFVTAVFNIVLVVALGELLAMNGVLFASALAHAVTYPYLLAILLRQTGLSLQRYALNLSRTLLPVVSITAVYILYESRFVENAGINIFDLSVRACFLLVLAWATWCLSMNKEVKAVILEKLNIRQPEYTRSNQIVK